MVRSVVPKEEVDTAQYQYRLYNVSNARNYDFAFNDGRKFKVVATDGGLLNQPVEVDHITLGAAERVEIIVDFSQDSVGSKVMLVSQPTKGDMMNIMGGTNGGNSGNGMTMLHGLWSDLEVGENCFVRKHTIVVQPGSKISMQVNVDAKGLWAYHCHLLYHMSGMFRKVIVS